MTPPSLVSLIVAARNAGATLDETLRSAVAQTHRQLEIIVVDDGSTDGTAGIASAWAAKDPRISLIRQPHKGLSAARNAALAVASGVYVAPLDADDVWHPAKLARQVAAAESAADPPGFVYCWLRHIDGEGRIIASGPRDDFEGCIVHRHLYKFPGAASGVSMFRREAVIEAGSYDERLDCCEDILLQVCIASRHPVVLVPEYLLGYRSVDGSLSRDRDAMLANWTRFRLLFRQSCPGVIHRSDRWMYARQFYKVAEGRLRPLRLFAAAGPALRALCRDPLATLGTIWLRASSLLRPRPRPAPGPFFADVDPGEIICAPPGQDRWAAKWLGRLDARRLAKLARRDAAYAARNFAPHRCG